MHNDQVSSSISEGKIQFFKILSKVRTINKILNYFMKLKYLFDVCDGNFESDRHMIMFTEF